jgi:hypothetical protein
VKYAFVEPPIPNEWLNGIEEEWNNNNDNDPDESNFLLRSKQLNVFQKRREPCKDNKSQVYFITWSLCSPDV